MKPPSLNGERVSPSMAATYTVDVPELPSRSANYPTWLDKEVKLRILEYDFANPLGISAYLNWVVSVYVPVLVVLGGLLNVYALCVLRNVAVNPIIFWLFAIFLSGFLRSLVIQPLIRTLLLLHILMLLIGPLYIWLVQCLRIHLSRQQLYPCFLLLWGHNFAAIATSSIVVAMILERALSLGKPEILWELWQKACRNTIGLVLVAALVLAVGGLMCIDGTMEHSRMVYPICVPWWDNEHGSVSPLWNKIITFNFTLGPSMLILLSLGLLLASLARFKKMLRSGLKALNHYNAMYLEVRSTLHMKFVRSVWWLGSLYIIVSVPLGCFVIFGPAIYNRIDSLYDAHRTAEIPTTTTENSSVKTQAIGSWAYSIFSPLDHSYLLVSRSDTETLLWLFYYSFSLFTVPVLWSSEVLFRREWKGPFVKIIRILLRRRRKLSRMSDFFVLENDGDLHGPYVAKDDTNTAPQNGIALHMKANNVQIFDASKAVLAGRRLQSSSYV